jgi:hypothetical protein
LIELGYERDFGSAGTGAPATGSRSRKRWTRPERILIETSAVLRTLKDPRPPSRAWVTGATFAIAFLATDVYLTADLTADDSVLARFLSAVLAIPLAGALTVMLAPSLLRRKRRAVKRWRAGRLFPSSVRQWLIFPHTSLRP